MGMFDWFQCDYPIDAACLVKGWQTKDTPAQYCEYYKIDAAGALLHHDTASQTWQPQPGFRGEIVFYGCETIDGKECAERWWEYSALFNDGKLIDIRLIEKPEEQPSNNRDDAK